VGNILKNLLSLQQLCMAKFFLNRLVPLNFCVAWDMAAPHGSFRPSFCYFFAELAATVLEDITAAQNR
jgi:hypothetical protein